MYDPFFQINFYPSIFPIFDRFWAIKQRLVHFLGGYILSSESMWKGGRLSETKVSETLSVQSPACLSYLKGR
jgi:hypothetical protein